MAAPPFYLQIADSDGKVVRTRAGGAHEAELVDLLVANIMARGVGLLRTSAHVEQDIREGIVAALLGLKIQNPFDVTD